MNIRLFHKIGEGGDDSAFVRQFIVENSLHDLVEFSNVAYESDAHALHEQAGGHAEPPVLVVDGKPIVGKQRIIDWLKTNILCLRD